MRKATNNIPTISDSLLPKDELIIYQDVHNPDNFRCYIDDLDRELDYYHQLFEFLVSAEEHQMLEINLASNGGYLDLAIALRGALLNTKARTTANIISHAHSAASIVALSCTDLCVNPYASMMIHYYSSGYFGKGSDIEGNVQHTQKQIKKLMSETYEHFLSPSELDNMFKGVDFWLDADEIVKRWNVAVELQNAAKEAEEKAEQKQLYEVSKHQWIEALIEEGYTVFAPKQSKEKKNAEAQT